MDRFLTKTPRTKHNKDVAVASSSTPLRQSTIHSLKRVVVVEDIKYLKSKLELSNQSTSVLLESLSELGEKIPPQNVLKETKIGHIVNKLRKHPDQEVAREARRVYTKWRTFFEEKQQERPQIEVKCDKKTESMRLRGKILLSEALGLERDHELVVATEMEMFQQHKRLISPAYRRSMRTLIMKLKNDEDLRTRVLNRELIVVDLVKQHKKS